jgi:hypothetical protein
LARDWARGEEEDGEGRMLGKKSQERREEDTEWDSEESKKERLLDEIFFRVFPNLLSQMDLPRLLELL